MWMVARMPANGRTSGPWKARRLDARTQRAAKIHEAAMAIILLNMAFLPLAIGDRKT
jgi:hypothetical protein